MDLLPAPEWACWEGLPAFQHPETQVHQLELHKKELLRNGGVE